MYAPMAIGPYRVCDDCLISVTGEAADDLSAVSVVNCNSVVFVIRLHRNTSSDFETSSRRMSDTLLAGSIASSRK